MTASDATQPLLRHWPAEAAARLGALIRANAHQGAYAVFDADNTTYHLLVAEHPPRGCCRGAAQQHHGGCDR